MRHIESKSCVIVNKYYILAIFYQVSNKVHVGINYLVSPAFTM